MVKLYLNCKKLHQWLVWLFALPLLVVFLSGVVLQQRGQFEWIQPAVVKGSHPGEAPRLDCGAVMTVLQRSSDLNVQSWADVKDLGFRPGPGIFVARLNGNREVQIDASNGAILKVAVRNTNWLLQLHEGEWFAPWVARWIFVPACWGAIGLWVSGLVLLLYPRLKSRRRNAD